LHAWYVFNENIIWKPVLYETPKLVKQVEPFVIQLTLSILL